AASAALFAPEPPADRDDARSTPGASGREPLLWTTTTARFALWMTVRRCATRHPAARFHRARKYARGTAWRALWARVRPVGGNGGAGARAARRGRGRGRGR